MCQCMLCGCIWYNCCGVPCGGCHEAYCVCSYWICKPMDLALIDPLCCHICAWDGWGYNCLWDGCICYAPLAVVQWSGLRTAGRLYTDKNQTIIINNPSPVYMGNPQMGGNYNMNANMNGNMNMNMNTNMGMNANIQGPNMNVSMNTGGLNMQAKTTF